LGLWICNKDSYRTNIVEKTKEIWHKYTIYAKIV
jgi:hypothetical protein